MLMHTLGDMARALNRSPVYLRGLQARFELPVFEGAAYSEAYLALLRSLVFLRVLGVSEENLRDLWRLERKLLQLLHADATGSPTWFLDSAAQTGRPRRRLLLSRHDLGVELPSKTLQLGLNFTKSLPELFAGREMGEDALRVLGQYLALHRKVCADAGTELPLLRQVAQWARRTGIPAMDCDRAV